MTSAASVDIPRFRSAVLSHPPCVPDSIRRQHAAFIAGDTRFAAAARVLSALWRHDRGLPAGVHVEPTRGDRKKKPRRVKAGWRLTSDAAQAGATFLHPDLLRLMRRELVLREPGALWDHPKILSNLLASQGLALNLFGPQALDFTLATRVWSALLPEFVHAVVGVVFETSPGRNDARFFSDSTAFDVRLDIVTPDGEPAFIAIEMKYIEALVAAPAMERSGYVEAARASKLFVVPDTPALYRPGLEQLRREHTLSQKMVDEGLYGRGLFVLVGPALNAHVTVTAKAYVSELRDPDSATAYRVGFKHLKIETILAALQDAGGGELAHAIHDRYLDMDRVTRVALADDVSPLPPASPLALPPPDSQSTKKPQRRTTRRSQAVSQRHRARSLSRARQATGVSSTRNPENTSAPTDP